MLDAGFLLLRAVQPILVGRQFFTQFQLLFFQRLHGQHARTSVYALHRHSSSVNFEGARHFWRKFMHEIFLNARILQHLPQKLTKMPEFYIIFAQTCLNFTWHLNCLQKTFFPNFANAPSPDLLRLWRVALCTLYEYMQLYNNWVFIYTSDVVNRSHAKGLRDCVKQLFHGRAGVVWTDWTRFSFVKDTLCSSNLFYRWLLVTTHQAIKWKP